MTVSGLKPSVSIKSGYSISEDALRALQSGDVEALMESHRGRWNLKMMADDGDDDDSDDDDDDANSGGGGKNGNSGAGDDGDDDDDSDDGADDEKVTKADLERMERRMKAADKRASEAEERLRKIDDSKKDDLTKAQDRVPEVEAENTTLKEENNSLRLEVAFLSTNDQTWHKPGVALRLAQSEGYLEDVVDDDGNVDAKAMKKALANLARDHEYLVNKGGSGSGSGSSGSSAGGRSGNGKDDKQQEEADKRRAPALSRRR